MDCDNQEKLFCADDNDYRVFCDSCDKLDLDRLHNNHLKSKTDINDPHKRQRSNNTSTNNWLT